MIYFCCCLEFPMLGVILSLFYCDFLFTTEAAWSRCFLIVTTHKVYFYSWLVISNIWRYSGTNLLTRPVLSRLLLGCYHHQGSILLLARNSLCMAILCDQWLTTEATKTKLKIGCCCSLCYFFYDNDQMESTYQQPPKIQI